MARERSIVVRLRAEVSDFKNQIGQASRSLSDFEREQQKLGGAATTTMGRMVQSARINEQAWSTTGRALLGVGTAMAGVGTAVLKTGIEYNTLQQTSRKALTTLTGSAEAANVQMDKLDAFARTSPFAKQVFIQAQQQMLGFGIEARKVIPYLDAIQNTVAALGGSNQDITELSEIFSKVQASAKITAVDLMQFGKRGVDAATLIGSQMGKTGAQIRADITAGALDAGAALDALAAGMEASYGGAAAGVKETILGAFDRVKAAFRDIASEFAKPLVDPDGGGALIGWLNTAADAMRHFEANLKSMPDWMKSWGLGIGAMGTAAAVAGGTFMLAVPKYVRLTDSIADLAATHPRMAKFSSGLLSLSGHAVKMGTVATAAAAGFVALAKATERGGNARGLNELQRNIEGIATAGGSPGMMKLIDIFDELPTGFGVSTIKGRELDDVLEKLLNPSLTDQFAAAIGNLFGGFGYMDDYAEAARGLDEALVSMLNAGGLEQSAALDFIDSLGLSTDDLAKIFPGARDAIIGLEDAAGSAAGAAGELADGTDAAAEAAERAKEKMEAWIALVMSAGESFGGILDAYDAVISKNDEMSLSTSQTMSEWIAELQNQAQAVREWKENYFTALDQIRHEVPAAGQEAHREFVEEMLAAGESGAAALQTFVDGTPAQRAELVAAWQGAGFEIQELLEEGHKPLKLDVDTSKAISDSNAMMGDWDATTTETNLSANTDPAKDLARALMGDWEDTTTPTKLDADPGPAVRVFDERTRSWKNTTTRTLLSADPDKAVSVFNRETGKWERTTTRTLLGLDTGTATEQLNSWKSRNSSFTVWATVQTRGGAHLAPLGKYGGGFIPKTLPGLNAGGRVPGPRAGYDNVAWPLRTGGRVLTQPLEGGEYVVRSSQALRYAPQLEAMNSGTFPTSGGGSGPVSVSVSVSLSDAQFARLESAMRSGVVDGFSGVVSGSRLSGVVR